MQTSVSFTQGEILDDFKEIAFATPLNIVALESYREKSCSQANVQWIRAKDLVSIPAPAGRRV